MNCSYIFINRVGNFRYRKILLHTHMRELLLAYCILNCNFERYLCVIGTVAGASSELSANNGMAPAAKIAFYDIGKKITCRNVSKH